MRIYILLPLKPMLFSLIQLVILQITHLAISQLLFYKCWISSFRRLQWIINSSKSETSALHSPTKIHHSSNIITPVSTNLFSTHLRPWINPLALSSKLSITSLSDLTSFLHKRSPELHPQQYLQLPDSFGSGSINTHSTFTTSPKIHYSVLYWVKLSFLHLLCRPGVHRQIQPAACCNPSWNTAHSLVIYGCFHAATGHLKKGCQSLV